VIHTVGPVWRGGDHNEAEFLQSAYTSSLQLALQHGIKSMAFPNISTGVYAFPKALAAEVAIRIVRAFLQQHPAIEKILFVCFDDENFRIYRQLLGEESLSG